MSNTTEPRTVWLAGATGLVGRHTLDELLKDSAFSQVTAITRRPIGRAHERLRERIVDFSQLEAELAGAQTDIGLCCLGTTSKLAGSREAFRRVDHDYVLAFARACLHAGAQHFLVVTALGANPRSLAFYNRVKGDVERALRAMPWKALTIARPSLLLGARERGRLGEQLAAPVSKLMPLRYRGIGAHTVGKALARLAREEASGQRVVLSDELQYLGNSPRTSRPT